MVSADQNPFRVARIEALPYRAPDFDWDAFIGRIAAPGVCGAIVGPHGAGKTTLLLEAKARLEARGIPARYVFLNEEMPRKFAAARAAIDAASSDCVLFLDGAEQLGPIAWRRIRWRARRFRGFVITVHRPGRLPALYTARTGEALLRELLQQLAPADCERLWPRAREEFARNGGNIREVFFALYDACARDGG